MPNRHSQQWETVLECPDRPQAGPDTTGIVAALRTAGAQFQWRDTVDLERKTALRVIDALERRGRVDLEAPYIRFAERPAFETAVQSSWVRLGWSTSSELLALGGRLYGAERRLRRRDAWTREPSGGRCRFASPERASGWASRCREGLAFIEDPFLAAAYIYAETVLSHPLEDGNGRLARASFVLTLAQRDIVRVPCLPLGPLFYANQARVVDAQMALSRTGDWDTFVVFLEQLTRHALRFAMEVGRPDAPPSRDA